MKMFRFNRSTLLTPFVALLMLSPIAALLLEVPVDNGIGDGMGVGILEDVEEGNALHYHHHVQTISNSLSLSKDFALSFDEELGRGEGKMTLDKLIELDNNLIELAEILHFFPVGAIKKNLTAYGHVVESPTITDIASVNQSALAVTGNKAAAPTPPLKHRHHDPGHDLPSVNKRQDHADVHHHTGKSKDAPEKIPAAHHPHHPVRQRQFHPKFKLVHHKKEVEQAI